eukprot:2911756-Pyramimonas_sp.AAC.1
MGVLREEIVSVRSVTPAHSEFITVEQKVLRGFHAKIQSALKTPRRTFTVFFINVDCKTHWSTAAQVLQGLRFHCPLDELWHSSWTTVTIREVVRSAVVP